MDWNEAIDRTLEAWYQLRASIGEGADEVELLTEINAACSLCEKADQEKREGETKCDRCRAANDFGGCSGINLEMSECVVSKDWDGLRKLVDQFIGNLEQLRLAQG